jgi:hypothetical protein
MYEADSCGRQEKVVTHLQIASFFGGANLIATNMPTAVSGIRRTGIWPLYGNVFLEVESFLRLRRISQSRDFKWHRARKLPPAQFDRERTYLDFQILNLRNQVFLVKASKISVKYEKLAKRRRVT